ncbi:DUF1236 domain-containing protein [Rhizobium sp. BK251]|uniref:DUF1236 domain-containing protein n=1 Tax=Rhizobium sp. BK251 TaxID=2512125 RepID=UPI0010521BB6|nr:DUF1236 domain-containing protein [Rhizobium sp. BK251]TCL75509.1 uncharacterized protein DUF1236 [Rhizobium sp. BK251]
MKTILVASAIVLSLSSSAWTQQSVIITDPATTGSTVIVPGEVRTYVTRQSVPSVVYDGDIIVGTTLPDSVELHAVPDASGYGYTIVNERRVIVDPGTHRVIEIME